MRDDAHPPVVFAFEDISERLETLPLSARRALERAGLRLSVEGWRSLPVEERARIARAGTADAVDGEAVDRAVRMSVVRPTRIAPVGDPDPVAPPAPLVQALRPDRGLDVRSWVRLRPLERYALVLTHRAAAARNDPGRLHDAYDEIFATERRSSIRPLWSAAPSASSRPPPKPISPAVSSPPAVVAPPSEPPEAVSTHLSRTGEAQMVDVGEKSVTKRRATATGHVRMRAETAARIQRHDTPKGEVLGTARIAAVMAAKRTHELIPLCHQIALTNVTVHLDVDAASGAVNVTAVVEASDRTGVEMEALTAVSVACLTIYDMLKGVDRDMTIGGVQLVEKSGGRTGHYRREDP